MKTVIQNKLSGIEAAYGIKILYACESGSRAWGFPSPDSDYDVRFIYTREVNDYLSVFKSNDHLAFPINDELDVYGWDLSKVLQLMGKSNVTPFEWMQSPVVYRENLQFQVELWALCQQYFCARSNAHHYIGIAKGALETLDGESIKIKKLFYVLRPLLSALWCVDRNTIAPMEMLPLMDLLPPVLHVKVLLLMDLKSAANEGYVISMDGELKDWIDKTLVYCSEKAKTLEKCRFDTKPADDFFRKMIM